VRTSSRSSANHEAELDTLLNVLLAPDLDLKMLALQPLHPVKQESNKGKLTALSGEDMVAYAILSIASKAAAANL